MCGKTSSTPASVDVLKPRPCPSSCTTTGSSSMPVPSWPSTPQYQNVELRQPGLPMFELNVAPMSDVVGSWSTPESLLARAWWYQVLGCAAPGKSEWSVLGPAEPRTALLSSQSRESKFASTRISTELGRILPQILAAYWNT